jgi:hypothetical protein
LSAKTGSEVELTTALDKKRRIDTAYEVYLGLYQAITGPEDRQKLVAKASLIAPDSPRKLDEHAVQIFVSECC